MEEHLKVGSGLTWSLEMIGISFAESSTVDLSLSLNIIYCSFNKELEQRVCDAVRCEEYDDFSRLKSSVWGIRAIMFS